jgi:hypothetical protein
MATKRRSTRAKTLSAKTLRAKPTRIKMSRAKLTAGTNLAGPKSSRDKVRAYRKRMRAKGFRLVQLWVPASRGQPSAEAHRQSTPAGRTAFAADEQAWAAALAAPPRQRPLAYADIADLVGAADGPVTDMRYKKQYLQATGYGRKRHR